MKQQTLTVRANTPLTPQVWRMVLEGDTSDITAPGQFLPAARRVLSPAAHLHPRLG